MKDTATAHPVPRGAIQRPLLLVILVMAAVVIWAAGGVVTGHVEKAVTQPVSAMDVLRADVARDPHAWLGRSLRVRASYTERCAQWSSTAATGCVRWQDGLVGAGDSAVAAPLPVVWERAPVLASLLRRVPIMARFVPAPQPVYWGVPRVYSVRLAMHPCPQGGNGGCLEAALVDATAPETPSVRVRLGRSQGHLTAQP